MNTIMAKNITTKNTNNVWAVYMDGEENQMSYCKSARSAMRFMFLLKSRTGAQISRECLDQLKEANRAAILAEELKAIEEAVHNLEQLAEDMPLLAVDAGMEIIDEKEAV